VHPSSRFSVALLLSLALWWPTLQGTLSGSVDLLDGSVRWVGAFVLASIAVRIVGGLLDAYAPSSDGATIGLEADDDAHAGVLKG
jgi:hypothetical protein